MEYEDMFPFSGIVDSIKHAQAYTKNDIKKINQLAKDNHLDVMPLLQTYGKYRRINHKRNLIIHIDNEYYTLIPYSDLRFRAFICHEDR